jgi:hypothetical protein
VGTPDNDRGYGVPDGLAALGLLGADPTGQTLLSIEGADWAETDASAEGGFRDSLISPGEEGSLLLRIANRGGAVSAPVRISLAGAPAGVELLTDSVAVPALQPDETYRTSAVLRARIDSAQTVPAVLPLAVRVRPESGGVYYRSLALNVVSPVWRTNPYPNPLVGPQSLTLDLELPGDGTHPVTVQVFDVTGRLRDVPFRDEPVMARGRLIWVPDHQLPTGVYFLRIQAPGFVQTRRVALIR